MDFDTEMLECYTEVKTNELNLTQVNSNVNTEYRKLVVERPPMVSRALIW